MKVKDILDMDIALLLVIIGLIVIFTGILSVITKIRMAKLVPQVANENVKILKKKIGTTGTSTTYYVTFELADGERKEFIISDQTVYENLIEGKIGTLTCQGDFYISFVENKK